MNRVLYKILLWLHPPAFRGRFGEEMLWIFDEGAPNGALALYLDALISLARQWLLRSGSWKVAAALSGALLQVMAGGIGWLLFGPSRIRAAGARPADPLIANGSLQVALFAAATAVAMVIASVRWVERFSAKRLSTGYRRGRLREPI